MYYNAIYIRISENKKSCWFPLKKCWCQQNLWCAWRDLYVLWIFFRKGTVVSSFNIAGYVWQILEKKGGGAHFAPISEQPQKGPFWIGLKKKVSFSVSLPRHIKWHLSAFRIILQTILKLSQNQNAIYTLTYPDYNQMYIKCCHRYNYLYANLIQTEKRSLITM